MAVPRLADELPFYLLDPKHLSISPWEAATKEGAAKAGQKVAATELPSVDMVVCGSVAVNRQGARIGKGGGFSDLEVAFLVEAGVLQPDTVLATTVHPLQVVDEPLVRGQVLMSFLVRAHMSVAGQAGITPGHHLHSKA
jgi:5-formyltetrahydrofolate cyclo-ligase